MAAGSGVCVAVPPRADMAAITAERRFINDDACGDWVLPIGQTGLEFQAVNALSAMCFLAAGAPLAWRSETTPIARAYGLMMCGVAFGSFSFHATTSLSGFMIDIAPMATTAALMLFRATHALQADAGHFGPQAESRRYFVAIVSALVAVYVPWVMMAFGVSHSTVWGVWAFLFGSMGAAFGVVAVIVFFNEGLLQQAAGRDLVVAIASIVLGLGCSVHSFLPGLCEGWRAALPLHAVWHVFSSVSANRCGRVLNNLTKICDRLEHRAQHEDPVDGTKKHKGASLLVRLFKRDFLPSQFSM